MLDRALRCLLLLSFLPLAAHAGPSPEFYQLLSEINGTLDTYVIKPDNPVCAQRVITLAKEGIQGNLARTALTKVVVEPLEAGAKVAVGALGVESALVSAYGVVRCGMSEESAEGFGACALGEGIGLAGSKGLQRVGVDDLEGALAGAAWDKAYAAMRKALADYRRKPETVDWTAGSDCKISVLAHWNKHPRPGAEGGKITVSMRAEACRCTTANGLRQGTLRFSVPVRYTRTGNEQPAWTTGEPAEYMVEAQCCSQTRSDGLVHLFNANGERARPRRVPSDDPPSPSTPAPSTSAPTSTQPPVSNPATPPAQSWSIDNPCPACEPFRELMEEHIQAATDADLQAAKLEKQLAKNTAEQQAVQGRIAALQGQLRALEGQGGSAFDPATGLTTSAVTQADGSVLITVTDQQGREVDRRTRDRRDSTKIRAKIAQEEGALAELQKAAAQLQKDIAYQRALTARHRKLAQDALDVLKDCLVRECRQDPARISRLEGPALLQTPASGMPHGGHLPAGAQPSPGAATPQTAGPTTGVPSGTIQSAPSSAAAGTTATPGVGGAQSGAPAAGADAMPGGSSTTAPTLPEYKPAYRLPRHEPVEVVKDAQPKEDILAEIEPDKRPPGSKPAAPTLPEVDPAYRVKLGDPVVSEGAGAPQGGQNASTADSGEWTEASIRFLVAESFLWMRPYCPECEAAARKYIDAKQAFDELKGIPEDLRGSGWQQRYNQAGKRLYDAAGEYWDCMDETDCGTNEDLRSKNPCPQCEREWQRFRNARTLTHRVRMEREWLDCFKRHCPVPTKRDAMSLPSGEPTIGSTYLRPVNRCYFPPVQPATIGPKETFGNSAEKKALEAGKAVMGIFGGLLGGGGGGGDGGGSPFGMMPGGGDSGPDLVDNPIKDAMQRYALPDEQTAIKAAARYRDDGKLLVSVEVDESPDDGVVHQVELQRLTPNDDGSCTLQVMRPGQWLHYGIYEKWWTKLRIQTFVNDGSGWKKTSDTGWMDWESGTNVLETGRIPASEIPNTAWGSMGADRAMGGPRAAGALFDPGKPALYEKPAPERIVVHVTKPESDPVTTVPFALYPVYWSDGTVALTDRAPESFVFQAPPPREDILNEIDYVPIRQ